MARGCTCYSNIITNYIHYRNNKRTEHSRNLLKPPNDASKKWLNLELNALCGSHLTSPCSRQWSIDYNISQIIESRKSTSPAVRSINCTIKKYKCEFNAVVFPVTGQWTAKRDDVIFAVPSIHLPSSRTAWNAAAPRWSPWQRIGVASMSIDCSIFDRLQQAVWRTSWKLDVLC